MTDRQSSQKIKTPADAFVFGAAEAAGKGVVFAILIAALATWVRSLPDADDHHAIGAIQKTECQHRKEGGHGEN